MCWLDFVFQRVDAYHSTHSCRQCAAGDDEPLVALVVGGRHPGHYFLDSGDFTDVVTRWIKQSNVK